MPPPFVGFLEKHRNIFPKNETMKKTLSFTGLFILSCQLHAQVSFVFSSTLPVGAGAYALAAADVNGDGKIDLACVNGSANTVTILTNSGAGAFVLSATYAVGYSSQGITAADVNGDGKIDLVTANVGAGGSLSVLTNDGRGGFVSSGTYNVAGSPTAVVAADVNGDGKIDLISANYYGNSLSVLTNNGSGGFAQSGLYAVGHGPYSVTAADVNGNGKIDLISANGADNTLSVLTNNGNGIFVLSATYAVGSGPQGVTAADVNGDGKIDLISANQGGNSVSVLTNNGSGGFALTGTYAVGNAPWMVAAADINGDGKLDLISANSGDGLSVLTNNGSGGFSLAANYTVGNTPRWVTAADVNGDGKIDLISVNSGDNTLTVLTNATPPALNFAINANLTNSSVVIGQNYSLSVSVTSTNPVNYQWYFVPANNSGQAGAYAQTVSGFCVGAVITNGGFGYGNSPSVSFVGGGGSGASGYGTASNGVLTSITVTAAGSGYTSLPAVVIGAPNGYYYGQTNSTLTITNASQNSVGTYYVVITNRSGSVSSRVVSLTLLYPPGIVQNPMDFTGGIDSSNTLSVVASGTPPLFYQWMLNGTNIAGATSSNFAITDLTLGTAGSYSVEVTNAYGSTNSSSATVALLPSLVAPFAGAIDIWGQDAVLSVGAVGSGSLSYQWYFNGQAIAGATGSSYALNGIQFTNAGLYNVVVSSTYGSVTNTAYQVVVNPANTSIGLFAGVTIQGTVGYNYNIQSTTNLSDPNSWVTLTNITLTSPIQIWNDNSSDVHNPSNPQKFYQVLPGQ